MKNISLYMIIICMSVLIYSNIMAAGLDEVSIGGFISQGYLQTSKNNYLANTEDGSFQFNEMGLNFRSFPTNELTIGCQFFARDLGEVGNDEVTLNWAFAEYSWREWMGLRAGLIKVPGGFYNDTRDMDMLRTSIFLPSSVYNEWFRDGMNSIKGLEIFGNLNLGKGGTVKYQVQNGETQIPTDSGTARYFVEVQNSLKELTKFEVGKVFTSKLEWITPLDGLRLGGSYGEYDFKVSATLLSPEIPVIFESDSTEVYIWSAEYTRGDMTFAIEDYIVKGDSAVNLASNNSLLQDTSKEENRYYVSGSYRFTDWLQLGTYYSFYESDIDASGPSNELKDICLSLRFDINDYWIAKIEGHKMDGLFGVEPEEDGTLDEDWYLFAAKMTFNF